MTRKLRLAAVNGEAVESSQDLSVATLKNTEGDVGSRLVRALEEAYAAIREQFPEVPDAVIVISSSASKYGHFARSRWNVDGSQLPEIMVSAEGLKRPPRDVLGTLLHEAAHGLAYARGIQDTAKNGRYHNKKFAHLAEEIGLQVDSTQGKRSAYLGHANTTLPEGEWEEQLDTLTPRLKAWREHEVKVRRMGDTGDRWLSVRCSCTPARNIRISRKTLNQGVILCGLCGGEFE